MTDYSDWVPKEEREELLFGPVQDDMGRWAYVYKRSGQIVAVSGAPEGSMKELFEPPVVWTYYRENSDNELLPLGRNWPPHATHRSRDGGDTIERIKE